MTRLYERGMRSARNRECWAQKEREERQKAEETLVTSQPIINKGQWTAVGSTMSDYMASWAANRENRLEKMRMEIDQAQKIESQGIPQLNRTRDRTQKLLENRPYRNPMESWKEQATRYRRCRTNPDDLEPKTPTQPGEVDLERLNRLAAPRLPRESKEETSSSASVLRPNDKHEQHLVRLYTAGVEKIRRASFPPEADPEAHRPALNARSLKMAANMTSRKPLYQEEKPAQPVSSVASSARTTKEDVFAKFLDREKKRAEITQTRREIRSGLALHEEIQECTFAPEICKGSRLIAEGAATKQPLFDRAMATIYKKAEKAAQRRQELVDEELRECTFKPQLHSWSYVPNTEDAKFAWQSNGRKEENLKEFEHVIRSEWNCGLSSNSFASSPRTHRQRYASSNATPGKAERHLSEEITDVTKLGASCRFGGIRRDGRGEFSTPVWDRSPRDITNPDLHFYNGEGLHTPETASLKSDEKLEHEIRDMLDDWERHNGAENHIELY